LCQAQAASKAIKNSVTVEKTDPAKLKVPEVPEKPRGKQKEKLQSSQQWQQPSQSNTPSQRGNAEPNYNCFVKVVRCEEIPTLKPLMKSLLSREKYREGEIDKDGAPESKKPKYEIVYAPAYYSEKKALAHISKGQNQGYQAGFKFAKADGRLEDLKGHVPKSLQPNKASAAAANARACGKTMASNNPAVSISASSLYEFNAPTTPQKSISLVMVHPQPGSKIINAGPGRESKSSKLHDLISDPSIVISNTVEQVTSGSSTQHMLPCSYCKRKFLIAKDLIAHKRLNHACSGPFCTRCGGDYADQQAMMTHACCAQFRCDICGQAFLTAPALTNHAKTHPKVMCGTCCFTAGSREELKNHLCGGRPVKVGLSAMTVNTSSGICMSQTVVKQYLCQKCSLMFPSQQALATHMCVGSQTGTSNPSAVSTLASMSTMAGMSTTRMPNQKFPLAPVSMDSVLPEVEHLAKFYSNIVFQEKQ
jgi:hypothetical protein